jgi:hypothetical protein
MRLQWKRRKEERRKREREKERVPSKRAERIIFPGSKLSSYARKYRVLFIFGRTTE